MGFISTLAALIVSSAFLQLLSNGRIIRHVCYYYELDQSPTAKEKGRQGGRAGVTKNFVIEVILVAQLAMAGLVQQ